MKWALTKGHPSSRTGFIDMSFGDHRRECWCRRPFCAQRSWCLRGGAAQLWLRVQHFAGNTSHLQPAVRQCSPAVPGKGQFVAAFPSRTVWGSPAKCSYTLTSAFHRVRGLCACGCFFLNPATGEATHCHHRSYLPSWRVGAIMLLSLSWLKIVLTELCSAQQHLIVLTELCSAQQHLIVLTELCSAWQHFIVLTELCSA